MIRPLISIILPVYNIKKYLPKCMSSLFAQTYSNLEFVLVDDGSNDGSENLCDAYIKVDNRVRVFHKENGGLSDARNFGIKHAMGEYISCVDPDDYVDADYIEYLYSLIERYDVKMSICHHKVHYDNGQIKDLGHSGEEVIECKRCIEKMLYDDEIDTSAWAKLYKKDLFNNVQYPFGKLFEDIATTYKLMMQCEYIAVGYEAKYHYIFHANSIVNGKFTLNKLDLIEMTDDMSSEVLQKYPNLENAVLRRQVYSRFSTLNQMLQTEQYPKIKKQLIKFILEHKQAIIRNKMCPRRDKLACVLLGINYNLYKFVWLQYRKKIMG